MSAAFNNSSAVWAASGRVATPIEAVRRTDKPSDLRNWMSSDPLPDAQGHGLGALGTGVREDQGEFVAAEPGDDVGFTGAVADDGARLDERLAARQVAVGVVDRLEAVQVEEQHRQRPLAAHGALGLLPQHLVEVARIRQQRQVVGHRQRLGALQRQGVVEGDGRDLEHRPERQQQRAADGRGRRRGLRIEAHQHANHLPAALQRQGDDGAVAAPAGAQILRQIARKQVVAVAHHPFGRRPRATGPRLGLRPVSAITVSRSLLSRATTAQHGAGSQLLAWRTSHSATCGASVEALASRVTWSRVSRRGQPGAERLETGFPARGRVHPGGPPHHARGGVALEARDFTAR